MKTSVIPTSGRTALTFGLLWLLTSLFVGLTPTHYLTSDATNNLDYVSDDNRYELWHGQHLLALWPGYATARLLDIEPYPALRLAHAVLAGATVALLYLALLALVRSQRIAVVVAVALCFSYGFWHYASDPDIYMAGYAALALLLLALVAALRTPGLARMVWLGLAAALAILTHQMNVEIAGLIGLVLVGLALRPGGIGVRWSHVGIYAVASLTSVLLFYLLGWREVSGWLVAQGEAAPGFAEWALRYFGAARSGAATWGVTLSPLTLPVAGYAVVQSWLLPPLTLDPAALLILALLVVGVVIVALLFLRVARTLGPVERVVALVCLLSLFANAVSGWWWQAGNVKFYLFMQLYVLVLVALVAGAALPGKTARRVRRFGLAALGLGLVLAQLVFTLPYETQGGVFRLIALYGDQPDAKLYIQDPTQDRIVEYVSDRSARPLPEQVCQDTPNYGRSGRHIWVLSAERAANCRLDGATFVERYYADRSRTIWEIWDVTAITTSPD